MASTGLDAGLDPRLEAHRKELTGYCYRMLGSAFDAEDAVQETLVRAWRSIDGFEARSSLRSWLHTIATNVCYDTIRARERRARPVDLTGQPAQPARITDVPPARAGETWIEPIPDGRVMSEEIDPAELAVGRESIRLAFVAALQHLPARQRAVLIMREVLRWQASEVADVLGVTVASVNSALQRARATLADRSVSATDVVRPMDEAQAAVLDRYVRAFEHYDFVQLVSLLHADATLSLPPYDLWMRGHHDICEWYTTHGIGCQGSRLVPIVANGSPAYGQYRPSGPCGTFEPWAIQVVELIDGKIAAINCFLDTERLFPLFGLPATLGTRPD